MPRVLAREKKREAYQKLRNVSPQKETQRHEMAGLLGYKGEDEKVL